MSDTIIAQCTPIGAGAIGLIRISGPQAVTIADKISSLASKKKLLHEFSHTIHYGTIIDPQGQHVDSALFLLMKAPKTYTGEDTVEITCHNNQFVIEKIISCAISQGARLAQHGEFTKLAVLNKKIDLIQAEAINELIHANSQEGIKRSLAQLEGSLSQTISDIEKLLLQALALSEASFEFLDEEELEFGTQISTILQKIKKEIEAMEASSKQQKQLREGIRIAFIGSVNAGKSSLFNALLDSERSIVTNLAGTTRDVVEAGMYKDGLYWTLADTAGLRKTDDIIELAGIEKSHQEAKKADIVLLVVDSSRKLSDSEITAYKALLEKHSPKIMLIYNKGDLPQIVDGLPKETLKASKNQPESLDRLESEIKKKIKQLFNHSSSPYLLSKRQLSLVSGLKGHIGQIEPLLDDNIQYELVSHELILALSGIAELTGRTISEKAMDAVFREFCVGK